MEKYSRKKCQTPNTVTVKISFFSTSYNEFEKDIVTINESKRFLNIFSCFHVVTLKV